MMMILKHGMMKSSLKWVLSKLADIDLIFYANYKC